MAFSALSQFGFKETVENLFGGPSLIQSATLDGALDLSSAANEGKHASILALDCGGAGRAVTLPTGNAWKGLIIVLVNMSDAAENLTVNTNLAVINQNEASVFHNVAGTWTKMFGFSVVVDQSA